MLLGITDPPHPETIEPGGLGEARRIINLGPDSLN